MKILSKFFAILSVAALIWVCAEPKALDTAWFIGELIGLAILIGAGRLSVYFADKCETL